MRLMFRIVLYTLLGFLIAAFFSTLIPYLTVPTWGLSCLLGALCGASIGSLLNRRFGPADLHPDGVIEYWESRSILPESLRTRYYDWLRSQLGAKPRS
jgi:hypothetical protein